MKLYTLLFVILLAFLLSGCAASEKKVVHEEKTTSSETEKAETEKNNTETDEIVKEEGKESKTEEPSSKPKLSTEQINLSTPKDTITTFVKAIQQKDGATIRKCLSTASIDVFQDMTKVSKKPIEEILIENFEDEDMQAVPKMRNQKVNGNTATIEILSDVTEKWDEVPFVKEGGLWKIAFDKARKQ